MTEPQYLSRPEILRRPLWSAYVRPEIHVGEPDVPGSRGRPAKWLRSRVEEVERRWAELERLATSPDYISHAELKYVWRWGAKRRLALGAPDLKLEHRQGRPSYYRRARVPLTPDEIVKRTLPLLRVKPGRLMPPARSWRLQSEFSWDVIDEMGAFRTASRALYPADTPERYRAHRRLVRAALEAVWAQYPGLRH